MSIHLLSPTLPHTLIATHLWLKYRYANLSKYLLNYTKWQNVPCAWQFICNASSNTLCTLFVQTNSSTCNYETPQRRSGQFDNTAGPHFSLGLRNYHWSTSSRKQHEMITGSQYSLWLTHIVLFRDTAAISQQKVSHLCMALLCCSQKWSGAPLHMKWGRQNGFWRESHIY